MSTVLVVEPDRSLRASIAEWLESAGHEVIACPGPSAPDFTCIGSRTKNCPLAAESDVVVLDLRLASDDAMQGAPGWAILLTYTALGKKIVVIMGDEDPVRPLPDDQVAVIARPPTRAWVVAAVQSLLAGITSYAPFEQTRGKGG